MKNFKALSRANATFPCESRIESNTSPHQSPPFISLSKHLLPAGVLLLLDLALSAPVRGQDLILSETSLTVAMESPASFTVKLSADPVNSKTITVTPEGLPEYVELNRKELKFTGGNTGNWNISQFVALSVPSKDKKAEKKVKKCADKKKDDKDKEATLTLAGEGINERSVSVLILNDVELVLSQTSLTINEGGSGTFTVKLNSEPENNRTVNLGADYFDLGIDADSKTPGNQKTLTFTKDNWEQPQTVTLTAEQDSDAFDENRSIQLTGIGITASSVAVTVIDDEVGLTLPNTSLEVEEGGTTTFQAKLPSRPESNRTAILSSTNSSLTFSPASVTFTPDDWNIYKTITVNAAHDGNKLDEKATIGFAAAESADGAAGSSSGSTSPEPGKTIIVLIKLLDGSVTSIPISIIDDDVGPTLSQTSLAINEGGSETFTVKLNFWPGNNRTVTLTSTNKKVKLSPTSPDFTESNWSTGQKVTVTSVQDADKIDEDATINLTGTGIADTSIDVSVTDDEDVNVGLTLWPATNEVFEGRTVSFTVQLDAQPANNRTITLTTESSDVTLNPAELNFTPGNWSTVQTVVATAVNDSDKTNDSAIIKLAGTRIITRSTLIKIIDDDVEDALILDKKWIGLDEGAAVATQQTRGTFRVKLSSRPPSDRTADLESPESWIALNKTSLTFTPSNWKKWQTVHVGTSGVADKNSESATINITGDGWTAAASLAVSVQKGSDRGVTLSGKALQVSEGGSGTFTVKPAEKPAFNRTVRLDMSGANRAQATLDKPSLIFTPSNWKIPQTVTVSAGHDTDVRDETVTIKPQFRVIEGGAYEWVDAPSSLMAVTVIDDDVGLTLRPQRSRSMCRHRPTAA